MYDEYNTDEDSDTVKNLRKRGDEAVKKSKELEEQLAVLQGQLRTQSIRDILRDKGLPPKVANLVPTSIEPTAEAVAAWAKEYEDVLGLTPREEKAEGSEPQSAPASSARPSVDEQILEAFRKLNNTESAAGVVPPDKEAAQIAALGAIAKEAGNDSGKLIDILSGRT